MKSNLALTFIQFAIFIFAHLVPKEDIAIFDGGFSVKGLDVKGDTRKLVIRLMPDPYAESPEQARGVIVFDIISTDEKGRMYGLTCSFYLD